MSLAFHPFLWNKCLAFSHCSRGFFLKLHNNNWRKPISHKITWQKSCILCLRSQKWRELGFVRILSFCFPPIYGFAPFKSHWWPHNLSEVKTSIVTISSLFFFELFNIHQKGTVTRQWFIVYNPFLKLCHFILKSPDVNFIPGIKNIFRIKGRNHDRFMILR